MLSKHLLEENLIDEVFKQNKLQSNLINLIGPDLSYMTDFEMAINEKSLTDNDYYFVKKYHQEFWSGMGLEALQLWIPLNLKKGWEQLKLLNLHKWGHVPNRNREPIELPKNYKEIKLSHF